MPTTAETAPVSKPALWLGRVLSGLVILFLLFDGTIKLVPWPLSRKPWTGSVMVRAKLWREAWG